MEQQRTREAELLREESRSAARSLALDTYINQIRRKVRGNIVLPPGISGNPEAVFLVDQLPSGEVLDVRLKRGTGIPALDAAIKRAIDKSSPLPLPSDRSLFTRTLEFTFRPLDP